MYVNKTAILTYHSIDDSGSVISTSPEKFRSQMRYLAQSSFNVVSLTEIAERMREVRPFPEKTVAITFDDGFKNVFDAAYPVLRDFGFKATVFLVTGYCGRDNRWDGQLEGIPTMELLEWDEITEMCGKGIDFGVHTVNHRDLSCLSIEEAAGEILNSKSIIQQRLGKEVLCFAYPYGKENEDIRGLLIDEFLCACSTELGFVNSESDAYTLPRIDMYYFSKNNLFTWLENPLLSHYIKFRHVLRSARSGAARMHLQEVKP